MKDLLLSEPNGAATILEARSKKSAKTGPAAKTVQPISKRFPALETQEVVFTFFAPDAKAVHVAGNFNSWNPEATPLEKCEEGKWVKHLALRAGQYEYRYVVDGQWVDDPTPTQRAVNPHGGFNSILTVPLAVKTSIL